MSADLLVVVDFAVFDLDAAQTKLAMQVIRERYDDIPNTCNAGPVLHNARVGPSGTPRSPRAGRRRSESPASSPSAAAARS